MSEVLQVLASARGMHSNQQHVSSFRHKQVFCARPIAPNSLLSKVTFFCLTFCAATLLASSVPKVKVITRQSSVSDITSAPPPRNVYIDLGANWAQTLDIHDSLANLANIAVGTSPFTVFAFEASPYIAPFVENVTECKNKGLPPPTLPFPTSGSSKDLSRHNDEIGRPCPSQVDELRKCFLRTYESVLDDLKPTPELNSTKLILDRLSLATFSYAAEIPPVPKYIFVPAAVSIADSWLTLQQCKLGLLIGGVTSKGRSDDYSRLGDTCFPPSTVRTIDFPGWVKRSFFQTDLVILKMDVEGAEHDIIKSLLQNGAHELIDVLAWECHPKGGDCNYMRKLLKDLTKIKVFEEGVDYEGWLS